MKHYLLSVFLIWPTLGMAITQDDMADKYFSKKIMPLNPQERKAIEIGKKWQTGQATSKPVAASDGSISFVYGSGQTRIVCAVLQICDIALQAGEQMNNFNVGDPRFTIEPSVTGVGPNQRLHLIIKAKALDVGLDSSLVVTTDRRTYHFRLKSTRHEFMPYVSFIYPDEAQAKWNLIRQLQREHREMHTLPQTHEYLGNLHFNYQIEGRTRWKPVRVYNDGIKTIIHMPKTMSQTEAPVLLVMQKKRLFQKSEAVMVNYRVQGNRYIVDSVFDKALLVIGSGSAQEKVSITRCGV
ncbi:MAG: P-type conjugative transfer protein TrbG [Legionella sp.]|uniref:P-type conjugative transfer protein TrbG n=1 Tax=Legionella sp. TaxID=459 RepID=UPI0039E5D3A1